MSVLVTGGFGMLGSAAARALIDMGEAVVVLGRSDHRRRLADREGQFATHVGDIRDPDTAYRAMVEHGVDRVCHVAAVLGTGADGDPGASYESNVAGTVNLLDAARAVGARRFVFTSSKAVYAAPAGVFAPPVLHPVPEDHERSPANLYGATKLVAEQMVEQYSLAAGMGAALLRFSTTYGPGKGTSRHGAHGDISRIVEAALDGAGAVVAADVDAGMDCVYVDDIGRAIALAVTCERDGVEAYNIATGAAVSVADVVDAVHACTGRRVEIVPGSCDPLRHMVLATEKAEQHLGFRARFDVKAGVAAFVRALENTTAPVGQRPGARSGPTSAGRVARVVQHHDERERGAEDG